MALDVEVKVDSAEKLSAIAAKPTEHYLFAEEVNQIVDAVKATETDIESLAANKQEVLISDTFGAICAALPTEDDIQDSDKINFTDSSDTNNQKKTTWLNIKAKLISVLNALFVSKVTTIDVEKVYIKNADGTQSMKPTSELGGGDDYLLYTTPRVFIDFTTVNDWLCSGAGNANAQFLGGTQLSCGSGTTPTSTFALQAVLLPIPVGYIVDEILVNLNYKAYNTTNSTLEFFVQREETAGTGQVNTGSNPFTISNDTLVTTTGSTSNLRRIESLAINAHSLPSLAFSYLQIAIRETQNASYNAISLQIKFKKV